LVDVGLQQSSDASVIAAVCSARLAEQARTTTAITAAPN
jgi:hypothetical protein